MSDSKNKKADKKADKKKTNIAPAHAFIYKVSEAILVYIGVDYLIETDDQIKAGVVAFALLWIATDVAIWAYKNLVVPSALTIIKNNK